MVTLDLPKSKSGFCSLLPAHVDDQHHWYLYESPTGKPPGLPGIRTRPWRSHASLRDLTTFTSGGLVPNRELAVTPMMAQYHQIKAEHPGSLLFYRMGDFYEMFFDDAVAASEALDIALTQRGMHRGQAVPMCGVPYHSADGYLQTLVRKGFRIAICEQLESPADAKARGHKSVVNRGVTRLVSPGTVTEDNLLDARKHSFLGAFSEIRGSSAIAWTDITTGDFMVQNCPHVMISPLLAELSLREILISDSLDESLAEVFRESGSTVTVLPKACFDSSLARTRLLKLYEIGSLDAFGQFGKPEISAMGAVADYLEMTQKGQRPNLLPPVIKDRSKVLQIDTATRRNLELTASLEGERAGSLLGTIDRTITGAGARLLERRLASPSTELPVIESRLDSIAFLKEFPELAESCRKTLRSVPDMARALGRLALGHGGPRDLAAIRDGLEHAREIAATFNGNAHGQVPAELDDAVAALAGCDNHPCELLAALVDNPPVLARDGGFIAPAYDAELDRTRDLRDESRKVIASLQAEYRELSDIASLKIRHNNVLGYFVETHSRHSERMFSEELAATFIHRQTMANAVRFTTVELSKLEADILSAAARAIEIELAILGRLTEQVLAMSSPIGAAAAAVATIDVTAALSDLARGENWSRPEIFEDRRFHVEAGRHPVVESALRESGNGSFVANDCTLSVDDNGQPLIWLLTGPNMAGKSTFLRQNALILLLAQAGSFVPARKAEIGIASQLFSRVGAADDLARGRSTFMVEMVETAAILNRADANAFVILDEIGRGTATFDGLSIAWATLEYLHDVSGCRTIFATHYHELTLLSGMLANMVNATVAVQEWQGEIRFLYEVNPGAADRSYGVQVARLAGLPGTVIERAGEVLDTLEKGENRTGGKVDNLLDGLPLFEHRPSAPLRPKQDASPVLARLRDIHPDDLSPREALDALYELKSLIKSR